jgi:hypothetical protein
MKDKILSTSHAEILRRPSTIGVIYIKHLYLISPMIFGLSNLCCNLLFALLNQHFFTYIQHIFYLKTSLPKIIWSVVNIKFNQIQISPWELCLSFVFMLQLIFTIPDTGHFQYKHEQEIS